MNSPVAGDFEVLSTPPPGQTANLENPQHHGQIHVYVALAIGMTLSSLFMGLRLYTSSSIMKRVGIEEYLMSASFIIALIAQGLITWVFAAGAGGVHTWEMSVDTFNKYLLSAWIFTGIYTFCTTLVKLSLLLFCIRVEHTRISWYRASVVVTMFFMVCYALGIFLACLFACQPIRKAFDVTIRKGKCASHPVLALDIITAIWTLCTDAVVLFLCINFVKWWRLSKFEKSGFVGILMVGFSTIVSSAIRALYLFQALHSTDVTWDIPTITVWTIIKLNLTIICGCLPMARDFCYYLCPRLQAQERRTSSHRPQRVGPPALLPSWMEKYASEILEKFQFEEKKSMSTASSGRPLVNNHKERMSGQRGTDWSTTSNVVEENSVERMARSVHQQATRDYHSHLCQNWWDRA